MAAFAYPGPHCEQVGIFCDTLLSSRKLKLKKLTKGALTKGVLSELNDFRKENDSYILGYFSPVDYTTEGRR